MPSVELFIGIDPGVSGAIFAVDSHAQPKINERFADLTERDIIDILSGILLNSKVFLEKVGPFRGPGGRKQGVSSTWKFAQHYGFLRAAVLSQMIPMVDVSPAVWQRSFSLLRKVSGESITQKKNRHKSMAQQLFPGVRVTHKEADAMLIAEYGRKTTLTGER